MPTNAEDRFEFDSWDKFKSQLNENISDSRFLKGNTFVFRGQGGDDWPLEPSFSRAFRLDDPVLAEDLQRSLLLSFKSEMAIAEGNSDKATWALGQHQGLPTPLLDWSMSPYVAAFFAAESALRYMLANMVPGDMPPRRSFGIVALRRRGDGDTIEKLWNAMQVEFIMDMPSDNPRIRFQRGLFTRVPPMYRSLNDCVNTYAATHPVPKWLLKTCSLPYSEALATLRDLEAMDINFRRLYGGVDGTCRSATLQSQLDYFENHLLR